MGREKDKKDAFKLNSSVSVGVARNRFVGPLRGYNRNFLQDTKARPIKFILHDKLQSIEVTLLEDDIFVAMYTASAHLHNGCAGKRINAPRPKHL